MPLTKIDAKLYLNLDHIILLERDETGVVLRFVSHATDCYEGTTAANILNAVERPARRRRRRRDFAVVATLALLYMTFMWWYIR